MELSERKRGEIVAGLKQAKDHRRVYDNRWLENVHMAAGDQWAYFDTQSGRMMLEQSELDGFPYIVLNLIANDIDIIQSRLMMDYPIPYTRPLGIPDATGTSKRIADRWNLFFESKWQKDVRPLDMVTDMGYHLTTFGTVFRSMGWNKQAGSDVIKTPRMATRKVPTMVSQAYCPNCNMVFNPEESPTACPGCGNGQGLQPLEPKPVEMEEEYQDGFDEEPMGDISSELIPCYEIFKPPAAPTLERCDRLWRVRFPNLGWIKRKTGNDVPAEDGIAVDENWDIRIQSIEGSRLGHVNPYTGSNRGFMKNTARFIEYWEEPGTDPDYPDGLYVQAVSNEFLPLKVMPYPHKRNGNKIDLKFGMQMFRWEQVGGRFWGRGHVERVTPAQKQINAVASHLIYQRKLRSVKLVVGSQQSNLTVKHMLGALRMLTVKGNVRENMPQMLDLGGADPKLSNELSMAIAFYERVGGLNNILRGEGAPGIRTSSGQNQLREQAEAPIIVKIRDIYAKEVPLAREAMRLVLDNYDPKRPIVATSANSVARGFYAEELQPDVELYVDLDAAASLTLGEKQARQMQFMQTFPGLLPMDNPQVLNKILTSWRLEPDFYSPSQQAQRQRAERKLEKALKGDLSELYVSDSDDDRIHLQILTDYLQSEDAATTRQENPQVFQQIEAVYMQHSQRLTQSLQAMRGGAGVGAGPSPPPQGPMIPRNPAAQVPA